MLLDAEQGSLRSSTISFMNELVQYKIALSVLISKCDKKPAEDVEKIRELVENQCRLTLSQEVSVGTCSSVLNNFACLEQILSGVDVEGAIKRKLEAPCHGYINGLVGGLTSRASVLMTNTSDLEAKLAQLEADKVAASAELQESLSAQHDLVASVDDVLADVRQALANKSQHLATVCFQNKGNQDVIQSEFISVIRPAVVNSVQSESLEYNEVLSGVIEGFLSKGEKSFNLSDAIAKLVATATTAGAAFATHALSKEDNSKKVKDMLSTRLPKGLGSKGDIIAVVMAILPMLLEHVPRMLQGLFDWINKFFGPSETKQIEKVKLQLEAEAFPQVVAQLRPTIEEIITSMRAESTAAAEQAIAEQAQQYEQAIARLRAEEERSVAEREAEAKRLLEVAAELRSLIA